MSEHRAAVLITGVMGHLGNTVARLLLSQGKTVWGLDLKRNQAIPFEGDFHFFEADVTKPETLEPSFQQAEGMALKVVHTAGIVSIASHYDRRVYDVNVNGTKNILEQCEKYGAQKLVHVSSVHAIPEGDQGERVTEPKDFDPDKVVGLYAKTKAEATKLVLDAASRGLDASVVHPSGILGPGDYGHGHLTQLISDYLNGRLTACIAGGYDFVDVRDVAAGIVQCLNMGQRGQCYILSGKSCSIPELLNMVSNATGHKKCRTVLPFWFAKATAPLSELYYRLRRQPPLYTTYSLYTLSHGGAFSHDKATRELGYEARPLDATLRDTAQWLMANGRVKWKPKEMEPTR